ncbi:MAG: hypothetical protein GC155_17900 [Alphaproteobacteria bacterium]|nr:hypothetical protein [Alphaproteobacteria bacterium]
MFAHQSTTPPRDYANDADFDLGLDEYGIDPKLSRTGVAVSAATLAAAAVGGFLLGRALLDLLDKPAPMDRKKRR